MSVRGQGLAAALGRGEMVREVRRVAVHRRRVRAVLPGARRGAASVRRWLLRDSRGLPSITATLCLPAFYLILAKWLVSGFNLDLPSGVKVATQLVPAGEAIAIMTALLALWGVREYKTWTAPPVAPPEGGNP